MHDAAVSVAGTDRNKGLDVWEEIEGKRDIEASNSVEKKSRKCRIEVGGVRRFSRGPQMEGTRM